VLGPAALGVLASVDIPRPHVVRRPRVAIVGTGDELTDPGAPLRPGAIRDSNGPTLGGAVHRAGAELVTRMRAGDDLDATIAVLGAGMRDVDMLITMGGVSARTTPSVQRCSAWTSVRCSRTWHEARAPDNLFGSPGNRFSALVAVRLFVVYALDAMLGRRTPVHPVKAVADEELAGASTARESSAAARRAGTSARRARRSPTSSARCSGSMRSRSCRRAATRSPGGAGRDRAPRLEAHLGGMTRRGRHHQPACCGADAQILASR
jgi:molybdopterin biosynthesis enzyme